MPDWPVGLSTGAFFRSAIAQCLGPIREAGFSLVEVSSHPDHLDLHDRGAVAQAAQRLQALGMEPFSLHAPFADDFDITSFDGETRHRSLQELLGAAEAAARLGAGHLVIHPGPESSAIPEGERNPRIGHAVAALELVAARCRELGVRMVLENMLPHLFLGRADRFGELLHALQAAAPGVCLDTGHAFLSGDLHGVAQRSAEAGLCMLHASDNRGTYDDHLPPGEGAIPWSSLVRQLAELRFQGAIILEIARRGSVEETLHAADRARRHLAGLVAGAAI